jgi:hypothetical protein
MSSAIDYDALPAQLAGDLGAWELELATFYSELLRAAGDASGHLGQYVGTYLDMDTATLTQNADACGDWQAYLTQLWEPVENAWVAAHASDGIPQDAVELDERYRRLASSAQIVLLALQCFFGSVLNDTTSLEGLQRQANDDIADDDGGPNSKPLPNPWTATPQQMPRDILVQDILISKQGLTQSTDLSPTDITDFAGLVA